MPKLKTNSSTKKRFKKTGSGEYLHKNPGRRHLLIKKKSKRKRQLRGSTLVKKADKHAIEHLINE